ncbi:unnamed protein product [Heligmosomoides polygyrus]|uniref:Uncharacterized protein n=1 Tax=Heligmosomoides polygyrus TaxID=6339 RepID=A0A183FJA7_HELPZ|nr:unnamed protein product [Heligmosomoides polygyrus]
MRFFLLALILALVMATVLARPRTPEATREPPRAHAGKGKQKPPANYLRFGKRANPNADLLYLDQLIL